MDRSEHLLCCALTYKNATLREKELPSTFEDIESAKTVMQEMLLHEAKESFKKQIPVPECPYLHSVDIDTDEPGIIDARDRLNVVRRKLPLPQIEYSSTTPNITSSFNLPKRFPKTLESATASACKKESTALKSEEKAAQRREERERAKIERQQLIDNETTEERVERIARETAEKEERKRIREEKKKMSDTEERPRKERKVSEKKPVDEEILASVSSDQIITKTTAERRRSDKVHFFENPVPHDRHLSALSYCNPNSEISNVLTQSTYSEKFVLIHGPPGTGKTSALLNLMTNILDTRVLICAPTNVGAANLYSRCVQTYGKDVSLILPKERIPKGTPLMNADPCSRIVCTTISGRNGAALVKESFSNILIDEAGQCLEAWIWGLMRDDVEYVAMTGDTRQLAPTVSESGKKLEHDRSLFKRLVDAKYPCTHLLTQNRMHPQICMFPNKMFYDNTLKNGSRVTKFNVDMPYEIVCVDAEEEEVGTSFVNRREALKAVEIAKDLKTKFENVIILSPYTGHCSYLLSQQSGIPIHTIDSFQGREADAVVLSIVRTNNIGFWTESSRLNVALTRARQKLVVVGNGHKWKQTPLKELMRDGTKRNIIST